MSHLPSRLLLLIAGASACLLATNWAVPGEADATSLPQGAALQIGTVQRAPNQRVTSIAYTHLSRKIVSVADTVMRFHDAISGKLIRQMDDAVVGDAIAISPDHKWI